MKHRKVMPPRPGIDLFKENLARIEYKNGNPLNPMIHIVDWVYEGLCAPWQDALVIKLLGRNLGFQILHERLTRLWKLFAGFEMLDIYNGYFMIKFDM